MQGKITISRTHSNVDGDSITLTIKRADSTGKMFGEITCVQMTLSQFAEAITGVGRVSCEILSLLGETQKSEHHSER